MKGSAMRRISRYLLTTVLLLSVVTAYAQGRAIIYNAPPNWADWGSQLKLIEKKLKISVPFDNKNSGQSLSQLIAEAKKPIADCVYLGITYGIEAKKAGVTAPYKPKNWDKIPAGLKDPDGYWFTIHSGTLGFFVNTKALGGKPVPKSWADLLDPQYKGLVGYLDPASAFVGYAGAVAVNQALGGTMDNFDKAIAYFKKLKANEPIVPKQTAYARVVSGEIPILFDYDFNAYRAQYTDNAPVVFVIPSEGTLIMPYVMSMVAKAPNEKNAKRILDLIMSDDGQAVWANAYLRPVIDSAMSKEAAAKFLPASEYARAKPVDYQKMADAQKAFSERYLKEVQ
jgi:putative spermidine/putrescine transport system substrate-binding protein